MDQARKAKGLVSQERGISSQDLPLDLPCPQAAASVLMSAANGGLGPGQVALKEALESALVAQSWPNLAVASVEFSVSWGKQIRKRCHRARAKNGRVS